MENKPYTNAFQEVHTKVQAAKDKARKAKEAARDTQREDAEKEAAREGFDRASTSN
jgi:hypothetical protein